MGIEYSKNEDIPLRLDYVDAVCLISAYQKHQFLSVIDLDGFQSLFQTAFGYKRMTEDIKLSSIMISCQQVFCAEETAIFYTQEILSALVLLCHASWSKRATLLFRIYQCIGTEEMAHEDVILAAQIVPIALCRIWNVPRWTAKSLTNLSETIGDHAYTKLEKEIDDYIDRDQFVIWIMERFRESKTVATSEMLKSLYQSSV